MGGKKVDITTASLEDLDKLIAQLKGDQAKSKKIPVKKNRGGVVRGFSPIARPQRFKGVF
jgi:hypothetical protein